ncbi:hypothetical protein AGDE_03077 [Angomonas deanei]|nr:hypothetical protein AGDE_04029 [Angomonas deanei]EPY40849.1 hypothetical protein AGDE_03077 [Angomonas deanei]|eukprot:EPY39899.1 hypothetical protein AGDE_04029 [Angomonas deanei]
MEDCQSTVLADVEQVVLHFPALTSLLQYAEGVNRRNTFGRIFGVQRKGTVEVTEVMANPIKDRNGHDEETDPEKERKHLLECFKEMGDLYKAEGLEYFQVGIFAIANAVSRNSFYNRASLAQLVELGMNLQPDVMLTYDPVRTVLLGKPYIRAFVLTDAYKKYQTELKRVSKNNVEKPHEILKKHDVSRHGVFREVPVTILVDAFHALNLQNFPTHQLPTNLATVERPAVRQYMENVLNSLHRPLSELKDDVVKDGRTSDHNTKVKILLSLQQIREQAVHLEALCDSVLLNYSIMRDL